MLVMTIELKIDSYSFGKMTIGGKEFTSDLIIYKDGMIKENWWRAQGHYLFTDDITSVIDAAPEMLVIGTGAMGLMKVSEALLNMCERHGIEVKVSRTASAVKQFNNAKKEGKIVAACFHLTC